MLVKVLSASMLLASLEDDPSLDEDFPFTADCPLAGVFPLDVPAAVSSFAFLLVDGPSEIQHKPIYMTNTILFYELLYIYKTTNI